MILFCFSLKDMTKTIPHKISKVFDIINRIIKAFCLFGNFSSIEIEFLSEFKFELEINFEVIGWSKNWGKAMKIMLIKRKLKIVEINTVCFEYQKQ